MRKTSDNNEIVASPGACAKSKIVAADLRLIDVARAAKMAPATLSDYLKGRLTNNNGRFNVYAAYCKLTKTPATGAGFDAFWGRSHGREVA